MKRMADAERAARHKRKVRGHLVQAVSSGWMKRGSLEGSRFCQYHDSERQAEEVDPTLAWQGTGPAADHAVALWEIRQATHLLDSAWNFRRVWTSGWEIKVKLHQAAAMAQELAEALAHATAR